MLGLTAGRRRRRSSTTPASRPIADPAYSETVAAGGCSPPTPRPGERVLDGGTVTLTLSLGKERYDVPELHGLTEDEAQDALAGPPRLRRDHRACSETVPEGHDPGQRPAAGTTLRPGTSSTSRQQGPAADQGRRLPGKTPTRAEQVLEDRGLVVDRGEPEYSDTVAGGRRHLARPPTTGTLFRGETVTLVVSQGPELVEVPGGLVAVGRRGGPERSRPSASSSRSRSADSYLGLGFVFEIDPASGTRSPRAARSRCTWSEAEPLDLRE